MKTLYQRIASTGQAGMLIGALTDEEMTILAKLHTSGAIQLISSPFEEPRVAVMAVEELDPSNG